MVDVYVGQKMLSSHVTTLMRRINALEASVVVSPGGTFVRQFAPLSAGVPAAGQMRDPRGRFIYSGHTYICSGTDAYVNKYTNAGVFVSRFLVNSFGGAAPGPFDIYVDGANIYTLEDAFSYDIVKYDMSGNFISKFATPAVFAASATNMRFSGSTFLVSDNSNDEVYEYNTSGTLVNTIGTPGSGVGEFQNPQGMCFDGGGNLYVADQNRNKLLKFDPSYSFLAEYGTTGGGAGQFQDPRDVCFDGTNLYVIDSSRSVIVVLTTALAFVGEYDISAYGGPAPFIACDSDGYLYPGKATAAGFAVNVFAGENTSSGGLQTEFFSYTTTTKTSLGTPDGGVSIPALNALTPANNNADLIPRHIVDMRTALETIAPYFDNPGTGNPYNFTNLSPDNLYFVAVDRAQYGATNPTAYTWTRTEAQMEGDYCMSLDIGEIADCVDQLEAS